MATAKALQSRKPPEPRPEDGPIWIRPCQVKARFGIDPSTLYRWARAGRVTIHPVSNSASFVRVADLEKLITGGHK